MATRRNEAIYLYDLYTFEFVAEIPFAEIFSAAERFGRPVSWTRVKPQYEVPPDQCIRWSLKRENWYLDEQDRFLDDQKFIKLARPGAGGVNPNLKITLLSENVFVADDFYLNPEEVRAEALQDDWCVRGPLSSSKKTPVRTNDKTLEAISKVVGEKLTTSPYYHSGVYQMTLGDDHWRRNNYIHTDTLLGKWTAICYLNPPEQCQGGTTLWQHKETGHLEMPDEWNKNPEQVLRIKWEGHFEERWSKVIEIEMKWNRLAMFRANRFHRESRFFGTDLQTGRLVQPFFLSPAGFFKEDFGDQASRLNKFL